MMGWGSFSSAVGSGGPPRAAMGPGPDGPGPPALGRFGVTGVPMGVSGGAGSRGGGYFAPSDAFLPIPKASLAATAPWAPTLWLSEVPPSGSPLPFSGWRPRLSLRLFSWGSRALGVSGCLGPGSFPCLLHALRDGAVVPHTHY